MSRFSKTTWVIQEPDRLMCSSTLISRVAELGPSRNWMICSYLELSVAIWIYLELSGAIRSYLELSVAIWSYLQLFGAIWSYLELPGATWSYLVLSGAICSYLELSDAIWSYLELQEETAYKLISTQTHTQTEPPNVRLSCKYGYSVSSK